MKYYSYIRCSTKTQMLNNGTQMQEDVIAKYCEEKNIELTDSFVDKAISGKRVDRPALIDLLATLEKGDRVIVQNTSRLWRDEYPKAIIKRELEKIGADIISIEQEDYTISYDNPTDYLIRSIFEALDTYEKLQIALKLSKGRRAKVFKGNSKACGTAPYGYKWNEKAEIEIDYNNNLIVVDLFEKYLELKSLGKLQKYTIEKGYKTRNGKDFSKQALSNILHNDFYIGYVTHGDIKIKGSHEPIITEELFNLLNNI